MRESLEHFDPQAHVVPYCMSGGTDAKQFSRLGITGYGFSPLKLPAGFDYQALFHGVDERVPVEALHFGVRVLDRFLRARRSATGTEAAAMTVHDRTAVTPRYGTWPSPIDAATAAAHDGSPEYVGVVGDEVWWTAPRPAEAGRRALVRRRADGTEQHRAARAVERPQPRHRVRRHPLGGRGASTARRSSSSSTTPTSGSTPSVRTGRTPSRVRSPRCPRSAAACAGPTWRSTRTGARSGAVLEEFTGDGPTDVRRVPAAVPLDGSAAGGPRRRARTGRRATTGSSPARGCPPTADRPSGSPGTTRSCPGTAPSCGSPTSAPTAASARPAP